MKEQKNNDLKELDGNIQIYDNDDAYEFGEFSGPNYNENLENNDNVNNNCLKYNNIDKNGINQKDLLQKLDFNYFGFTFTLLQYIKTIIKGLLSIIITPPKIQEL